MLTLAVCAVSVAGFAVGQRILGRVCLYDAARYGGVRLASFLDADMPGTIQQALGMESISRLLGFLCERDVRTGYDQFCAIIRRIEESAKGGCIELFGDEMDEREMALRSGVMAALCTIHTCRLLEKERA